MQREIYELLKNGEKLTALIVCEKFNISREYANSQLNKVKNSYSEIKVKYMQKRVSYGRIYLEKYYYI